MACSAGVLRHDPLECLGGDADAQSALPPVKVAAEACGDLGAEREGEAGAARLVGLDHALLRAFGEVDSSRRATAGSPRWGRHPYMHLPLLLKQVRREGGIWLIRV